MGIPMTNVEINSMLVIIRDSILFSFILFTLRWFVRCFVIKKFLGVQNPNPTPTSPPISFSTPLRLLKQPKPVGDTP